jgi:N-acetylmuramoyl-L-alanine amidase
MRVVISSGHGKHVAGASGYIDEHPEAVRVVDRLAAFLRTAGVGVTTYEDTVSTSQNENLNRLVDFHNAQGAHDLDISVHFNAYNTTSKPMGCEVLYVTQEELADDVSAAIAAAGGFIDRGPKLRTDLFFLNNTSAPAILIETCFVDSQSDVALYQTGFDAICHAIAETIAGVSIPGRPNWPQLPEPPIEPPPEETETQTGTVSWFGGPDDERVSSSEGLAFISDIDQKPELFLPYQPEGTSGLARRLNPHVHYLAMRWDYDEHSKTELLELKAFVRNPKTGFGVACFPADWGPNEATGRLVDVSPGVMDDLGLHTDATVDVIFPYIE